jgi:hypothetical protein
LTERVGLRLYPVGTTVAAAIHARGGVSPDWVPSLSLFSKRSR